jgi:APA family basic amino acid/polyamine antiporter
LATAVERSGVSVLVPVVRLGAAVASLGALLSLIAGISRTAFAMAERRDLPVGLAVVHARYRVPHRADLAVGVLASLLVAVADLRGAIGFSSFAVLVYYAIANASAWTLAPTERRWPRWLGGLGLVGCLVLALALPASSVLGGLLLLGVGAATYAVRRRLTSSRTRALRD